jgi:hypothetical protein
MILFNVSVADEMVSLALPSVVFNEVAYIVPSNYISKVI